MTKPEDVKQSNKWWCDTCKTDELTQAEVKAHLKDVHGLEGKFKGYKKMLMHMDGDTWFSYREVTIQTDKGEIKLTNSTCSPPAKDDPMRFA